MADSEWDKTVDALRAALVSGSVSGGVELEAETETDFGKASLVTIVEAAGEDAETQTSAYADLCGLINKRLSQGASQVLGCLVINGDPDPDALVTGLNNMLRSDGTFTPVLPLSVEQARSLVDSGIALLDVVDPATALIEVAASRSPLSRDIAMTALEEIDELIVRHTES